MGTIAVSRGEQEVMHEVAGAVGVGNSCSDRERRKGGERRSNPMACSEFGGVVAVRGVCMLSAAYGGGCLVEPASRTPAETRQVPGSVCEAPARAEEECDTQGFFSKHSAQISGGGLPSRAAALLASRPSRGLYVCSSGVVEDGRANCGCRAHRRGDVGRGVGGQRQVAGGEMRLQPSKLQQNTLFSFASVIQENYKHPLRLQC